MQESKTAYKVATDLLFEASVKGRAEVRINENSNNPLNLTAVRSAISMRREGYGSGKFKTYVDKFDDKLVVEHLGDNAFYERVKGYLEGLNLESGQTRIVNDVPLRDRDEFIKCAQAYKNNLFAVAKGQNCLVITKYEAPKK